MSFLDGILKQVGGSPDTVAELAAKVGIDPKMVEQGLAALGTSHSQPGDTVELASKKSKLDQDQLGSIMNQIGGEGALGDMVGKLGGVGGLGAVSSFLDKDGDGDLMDDISGMTGGLFGKK